MRLPRTLRKPRILQFVRTNKVVCLTIDCAARTKVLIGRTTGTIITTTAAAVQARAAMKHANTSLDRTNPAVVRRNQLVGSRNAPAVRPNVAIGHTNFFFVSQTRTKRSQNESVQSKN